MTALPAGHVLGDKYAIERRIAEGGMSTIYLGYPIRGAALVAIKELRESANPAERSEDIHQFEAEYNILKSLQHPCLPHVLDFLKQDGRYYLVEEYVPGETLESLIHHRGRLPAGEAVALVTALLDVLEYLHKLRIIYRDLKPSNVLIGRDRSVRLIDFGAARIYREGSQRDTVPLGTPGFASPEHYGTRTQTDARSDIYSTGALLHFMLTGLDPQEGEAWAFKPPHELFEEIPVNLGRITMMALELAPEKRFQAAAAMRRALADLGLPANIGPTGSGAPRHLTKLRRRLQYAQPHDYYRVLETLGVGLFGIFFFAVSVPAWFASVPLPHPLVGLWLTTYAFVHPYSNWKRYRNYVVEIFEEGLRIHDAGGVDEILWNDVQQLRLMTPGVVVSHTAEISTTTRSLHIEGVWPGFRELVAETIKGSNLQERLPTTAWSYNVDVHEKIYERVV